MPKKAPLILGNKFFLTNEKLSSSKRLPTTPHPRGPQKRWPLANPGMHGDDPTKDYTWLFQQFLCAYTSPSQNTPSNGCEGELHVVHDTRSLLKNACPPVITTPILDVKNVWSQVGVSRVIRPLVRRAPDGTRKETRTLSIPHVRQRLDSLQPLAPQS